MALVGRLGRAVSFLSDHPVATGLGLGAMFATASSHPINAATNAAQEVLWGSSDIDNYLMGEDVNFLPFMPKVTYPIISPEMSDTLRYANSTTIGDAWSLRDQLNIGIGSGGFTQGVDEWTWRQAQRNVENGFTDQRNYSGGIPGGWSSSTQPYKSRAINNATGDIVLGMHNRRMA